MTENQPSVKDIILKRREQQSTPGARSDRYRVALVVEGGGMRGVVSAGMVSALENLNLRDSFDVVYGCSAGAISGAYFVAGQSRYGTTIFYENINNDQFINFKRAFFGRPVLSLEYLLDHVCKHLKILDVDKIIDGDIPLKIIATSVTDGQGTLLDRFANEIELFDSMRASARIPVVAGPPVKVRNKLCLDGALTEAVPYHSALRDGCTHVLALLTRPQGVYRKKPGVVDSVLFAPMLSRYGSALVNTYMSRDVTYLNEIKELYAMVGDGKENAVGVVQLSDKNLVVSSLEKSRARLVKGAAEGFKAVYRFFCDADPEVVELLSVYDRTGKFAPPLTRS